ncbi:MAG: hypothetical protein WD055_05890 [Candidatus Dependentiae bacterium]
MKLLEALEQKIVSLVELANGLKKENEQLKQDLSGQKEEVEKFKNQVEMLESSMLNESTRLQEKLNEEKELTKSVVDDLIKNIDAIIESENQ